jgi:alcohol dehydrogenase
MNLPIYQFNLPIKIHYGLGASERLGPIMEELGSRRVFVVTDKGVVQAGLYERIAKLIEQGKRKVDLFDKVEPNPRDKTVMEAVERYKASGADLVIGLGGGSSMDAAKAMRAMAEVGGSLAQYEGFFKFHHKVKTPLIAIPTTAGTGSEMGGWAVVTDSARRFKMGFGDPDALAPTYSLVDPALTLTLPPHLTAETGMDAFVHALEVYLSKARSPVTDAIALQAMTLLAANLREAWARGEDILAREKVMYASMMAGIAISNADCGAIHVIAEVVGGLYDIRHGLAIASFTPAIMKYNTPAVVGRMVEVARAMGARVEQEEARSAADRAWQQVARLVADLGIPRPSQLGVNRKDLPAIAKLCPQNMSAGGNPRAMGEEDYLKLTEECLASDLW